MNERNLVRESFENSLLESRKKKKVNEDATAAPELAGDPQYVKDLQIIAVKYNKDLQTLNDNVAKLKAQAMQNLINRQTTAKAVTTPNTNTTSTAQQQASTQQNQPAQQGTQQSVRNESYSSILEMVDDEEPDMDWESEEEYQHKWEEYEKDLDQNLDLGESPIPVDEAYGEESILIPREIKPDEDEYENTVRHIEPDEEGEQVERDSVEDDDIWEDENLVFYVLLDDKGGEVIAKIYREDEESDWIVDVVQGGNEILDNMAFYQDYDKVQIINYLSEIFDDVEELTEKEYNEFIEEQPKEEVKESVIEYQIGEIKEQ